MAAMLPVARPLRVTWANLSSVPGRLSASALKNIVPANCAAPRLRVSMVIEGVCTPSTRPSKARVLSLSKRRRMLSTLIFDGASMSFIKLSRAPRAVSVMRGMERCRRAASMRRVADMAVMAAAMLSVLARMVSSGHSTARAAWKSRLVRAACVVESALNPRLMSLMSYSAVAVRICMRSSVASAFMYAVRVS